MSFRKVAAFGIILLANRLMFADASYQETTQITGGSMVAPLKSMSFLSKSMRDMFAPITTTTMIHGNQKAVVGKDSIEITDLDKETVTHIDPVHKTYTVVTFAQMRQAFTQASKQMQQSQEQAKPAPEQPQQPKSDLKTSFDVSVKNTGATKEISGLTAQEQVVTLQMHVTDPNAPATQANAATYVVTTDAWITPDPPEVKEIQDFDKRFGQKLMEGVDLSAFKAQMAQMHDMSRNPGMSQMFAGKPGSAEAMSEMGKEMAKLQGTRVLEVTKMGGSGTGPATQNSAQTSDAPAAAPSNSNGSMSGMLGSALGSSALGAFHKKKAAQPASDTTTTTTTNADGTQTTSTTLMETTVQKSNFSQAPVASSNFEVPAGYKKVETPGYGAAAN
jgi:hypothetical protein